MPLLLPGPMAWSDRGLGFCAAALMASPLGRSSAAAVPPPTAA